MHALQGTTSGLWPLPSCCDLTPFLLPPISFAQVGSLLRANALRSKDSKSVNVSFGSKSNEEKVTMASA